MLSKQESDVRFREGISPDLVSPHLAVIGKPEGESCGEITLLPEKLAEQCKAFGVDTKTAETELQKRMQTLITVAASAREPLRAIPLSHTVLTLSSTEWHSLVSDNLVGEISFRANLHRALRQAVGLLASLQEELALYKVRRNSEYLWKEHRNTLFYLAYRASQLLPELEKLAAEAANRGLSQKADETRESAGRLRRGVEETARLERPQSEGERVGLGVDPQWEETRLQELLQQLISRAQEKTEPAPELPLAHSQLILSATEWQALSAEYPPDERSFRAELNRVLRQAVGLRAAIQEETVLYHAHRSDRYKWRRHLNCLIYLARRTEKVLPELKKLLREAQQRNLTTKAEHLKATVSQIERSLQEIARLRSQCQSEQENNVSSSRS